MQAVSCSPALEDGNILPVSHRPSHCALKERSPDFHFNRRMNFNTRRRSRVLDCCFLMALVVTVIHGQMDRQVPSQQRYQHPFSDHQQQDREMDEFDQYNQERFDEKFDKPFGPRPQRPPSSYGMGNKVSRMGEDFKLRMQNLRSMISGQITRSNSYEGSSSSSSYAGCCDKLDFHTVVPGFVLVAVSYALLFLLNATVTSGRRRRMVTSAKEEEEMLLDGPTWLSMVHELWEQDAALENTACTQETLCRMNRLAMAAPGQAGWAVSLSSLPLSYLLHTRHTGGFSSYMDAAMMGRSGANCTELYSSCPRLSY
ncbi:uncharacterized protein LOC124192619 isoform X2 [Daphnia pulex]|uniref:uncharacterized protein LOC124192619 isoform X2 n=1 Tax=Daphnia pulex TaxID=6669 RepID=UPI001EDDA314|nr:uncharacterized protein LOC124192619 isoform X2 [Daphnia pulex]